MSRRLERWACGAALLLFAALFVLPLLWMVSTSLQPEDQVLSEAGNALSHLIPRTAVPANYAKALQTLHFVPYLLNTLYVCALVVAGTLASCTVVAYGFSRLQWPGRDTLFAVMLATIMLPPAVLLLPQFVVFRSLGWVGTYRPLIVPAFLGNAFFIFLLRQFFLGIPQELTDAARVEGATEPQVLWHVITPLAKPALVTVTLLSFVWSWTDFMGPLVYLSDDRMYTLTVGLASFLDRHRADWSGLMAGTTLVTMPLAVLFLFGQRFFVQGIQMTGLKG